MILSPASRATESDVITAVSSRVSDDYVRKKLPDGTLEPELYSFGEGGRWGGSMQDDTIDKLSFFAVARAIAGPLASQNYRPATDPGKTKLLIMVYWGTTAGTSNDSGSAAYQNLQSSQGPPPPPPPPPPNASEARAGAGKSAGANQGLRDDTADNLMAIVLMQNHQRDRIDRQNAVILGYDSELKDTEGLESTALRFRLHDLLDEIEESRYFVVLMAYDFQLLLKEKKHKLLWETRFSIRERRNDFSQQLAGMAESASKYFGQDSHGLLRKPVPEGHVTLGKLKVIETVPEKVPEK